MIGVFRLTALLPYARLLTFEGKTASDTVFVNTAELVQLSPWNGFIAYRIALYADPKARAGDWGVCQTFDTAFGSASYCSVNKNTFTIDMPPSAQVWSNGANKKGLNDGEA
jgi:hypothetical protein